MATSLTAVRVELDRSLAQSIGGANLDRIIEIWLNDMGALWIRNMSLVMPYSRSVSRRGMPPRSKSGTLVKSLRKRVYGRTLEIYSVDYGPWLIHNLDRDWTQKAWERTRGQSQTIFNRAVQRVLGRRLS